MICLGYIQTVTPWIKSVTQNVMSLKMNWTCTAGRKLIQLSRTPNAKWNLLANMSSGSDHLSMVQWHPCSICHENKITSKLKQYYLKINTSDPYDNQKNLWKTNHFLLEPFITYEEMEH